MGCRIATHNPEAGGSNPPPATKKPPIPTNRRLFSYALGAELISCWLWATILNPSKNTANRNDWRCFSEVLLGAFGRPARGYRPDQFLARKALGRLGSHLIQIHDETAFRRGGVERFDRPLFARNDSRQDAGAH